MNSATTARRLCRSPALNFTSRKADVPRGSHPATTGSSLGHPRGPTSTSASSSSSKPLDDSTDVDILVAGAIAIDTSCNYRPLPGAADPVNPEHLTSNPAEISQAVGGVAFNVAKAARFSGAAVRLCSTVGDDPAREAAIKAVNSVGLGNALLQLKNTTTSQYVSFNNANKDLHLAMADMSIMEQPRASFSARWEPHLKALAASQNSTMKPKWLVFDANWGPQTLHHWLGAARRLNLATAFEPVSAAKSTRLFAADIPQHVPPRIADLASPNALELRAMHDAAARAGLTERREWWRTIDALGIPGSGARAELVRATDAALTDEGIPQRSIQLLPFVPNLVTKLGPRGVLLTRLLREGEHALRSPEAAPHVVARTRTGPEGIAGLYMRLFPPGEVLAAGGGGIVSTNGAGDTFLGVLLAALVRAEEPRIEDAVDAAQRASAMTLKSRESVSPEIARLQSV